MRNLFLLILHVLVVNCCFGEDTITTTNTPKTKSYERKDTCRCSKPNIPRREKPKDTIKIYRDTLIIKETSEKGCIESQVINVSCSDCKQDDIINSWPTFIIEFLKILIWPLLALIIFIRIFPYLKRRLTHLKNIKAGTGGFELEFYYKMNDIRHEINNVSSNINTSHLNSELSELLYRYSGTRLITISWRSLEDSLFQKLYGSDQKTIRAYPFLRDRLIDKKFLNENQIEIIDWLYEIRNMLLHLNTFKISRRDAEDYAYATLLIKYLIKDKPL